MIEIWRCRAHCVIALTRQPSTICSNLQSDMTTCYLSATPLLVNRKHQSHKSNDNELHLSKKIGLQVLAAWIFLGTRVSGHQNVTTGERSISSEGRSEKRTLKNECVTFLSRNDDLRCGSLTLISGKIWRASNAPEARIRKFNYEDVWRFCAEWAEYEDGLQER